MGCHSYIFYRKIFQWLKTDLRTYETLYSRFITKKNAEKGFHLPPVTRTDNFFISFKDNAIQLRHVYTVIRANSRFYLITILSHEVRV